MKRIALIALALPLVAFASGAQASAALAQKKGCMSCHHVAQKRIGPAYQAVAQKYKADKTAPARLAAKVKKGGVGVWGKVPMPPQAAVSEAEAKTLVAWILGGAK